MFESIPEMFTSFVQVEGLTEMPAGFLGVRECRKPVVYIDNLSHSRGVDGFGLVKLTVGTINIKT